MSLATGVIGSFELASSTGVLAAGPGLSDEWTNISQRVLVLGCQVSDDFEWANLISSY